MPLLGSGNRKIEISDFTIKRYVTDRKVHVKGGYQYSGVSSHKTLPVYSHDAEKELTIAPKKPWRKPPI